MTIELHRDSNFFGGSITRSGNDSSLVNDSFNDVVSSVRVTNPNEVWTLFEHVNFQGRSITVAGRGGPTRNGLYPNPESLGGRNDFFSSVRLQSLPRAGMIELYQHVNFQGSRLTRNGSDSSFVNDSFNDVISSVIVNLGVWTLFEHINFEGRSVTVASSGGPNSDGRYPTMDSLGGWNDFFSSMRLEGI